MADRKTERRETSQAFFFSRATFAARCAYFKGVPAFPEATGKRLYEFFARLVGK